MYTPYLDEVYKDRPYPTSIHSLRMHMGLSQQQFAKFCNISYGRIKQYDRNEMILKEEDKKLIEESTGYQIVKYYEEKPTKRVSSAKFKIGDIVGQYCNGQLKVIGRICSVVDDISVLDVFHYIISPDIIDGDNDRYSCPVDQLITCDEVISHLKDKKEYHKNKMEQLDLLISKYKEVE